MTSLYNIINGVLAHEFCRKVVHHQVFTVVLFIGSNIEMNLKLSNKDVL